MNPAGVNPALILDSIADTVLSADSRGIIQYINAAGRKWPGLKPGSNCLTGLFPDNGTFQQHFSTALQSGQPQHYLDSGNDPKSQLSISLFPASGNITVLIRETDSRHIPALLTETEQRLRTEKALSDQIINSLPGIFYMADTTPKLLRWNNTFETASGYSASELGSMRPIELFDTRDHHLFKSSMAQAMTEGTARAELRLVSRNGTITPYYFTGVHIEYNGRPVILGSGIDLTEQKKADEEIRLSGERYSLTTRATNDMIWDWNLLNDEIWWNNNYNKLFGYPENINLHHIQSWADSIHPDDRERVLTGIHGVIGSGQKFWTDQYRYLKKDGAILFVYDRGYVTHDENGRPVRMIGSMLDITDRIKAEEAIREKDERYRILFEQASDSIVVHDMSGNILDMNFAAVGFSGYSGEQLKRMKITDLLFPEDLQKNPVPFEKLKAGETTFNKRRVKTQSGVVRIMELSSRMVPGGDILAILRDVTERTEAERALRNSELRFRTLSGNAPVGIFETNAEGNTTYVNEKMMEYSGLAYDELINTGWMQCIHPDDRDTLAAEWNHQLEEKTESTLQYRIVAKDKSVRWVQGKAIPVFDKNGQFNGYLGTVSDITNEKLARLALEESEEKYRTLVEQAPDAIYIVNEAGNILTVNPSACRISGYTGHELLQMNILDFVFTGDLQENPFRFDDLRKGKTVIVERRFRVKDNKTVDVECLANMLSDGRVLVFARDISERIKTQNEILKEKNYSDSIINSLPGIFYLYDENGQFLRWNKNFEYISGYSADEISRMHPLDFFDEPDQAFLRQKVEEVFTAGMADAEAPFFTKDKSKIPYYFNGWRVIFENKLCLIGVGIDITEKRKAEELLMKSYEDIRRLAAHLTSIREEERKRIGREIHDELGQQLTAIKMDMAWISKRIPEDNELLNTRIRNVITLLDGSNLSIRRILTELSSGINDLNGLTGALERQNKQFEAATGIPVLFTTNAPSLQLPLDMANCIFRVYQESLTNIMRYADAKNVTGSLQLSGDTITVTITDDGMGFDLNAIPAKTSFGILGMKERVLSMKGKFEIKTAKGHGTTVRFKVPYHTPANQ